MSYSNPSGILAAVTPGDTAFSQGTSRGLYVGVSGDLVVTDMQGNEVTFVGVPAGVILPIRVSHVRSSSTATDIVALF